MIYVISRPRLLILAGLLLLCGISLIAKVTEGEILTFNVSYGVISAAEAQMQITSHQYQNTPAWLLTTTAKTYPFFDALFKVRDKIESVWDKENLRSLSFTKRLSEGAYNQYRIHTFDHDKKLTTYSSWKFKEKAFRTKELPIPVGTQDVLSAFYWTRQQNLVPGKSVLVNITTDGKTALTEVVVHRKETIDSIFGKKECLVIEPKLKSEGIFKQTGQILIWVTNDAYKVPLKMTSQIIFGAFTATLKDAANVPYKVIDKP